LLIAYRRDTNLMLSTRDNGGGGLRALGGLKLLAQIDRLFHGLVDIIIAGTGRNSQRQHSSGTNGLMSRDACSSAVLPSIDSPDGWTYAFEGGAHILFKHAPTTGQDPRFVPFSSP
jgi:hypothetical protein